MLEQDIAFWRQRLIDMSMQRDAAAVEAKYHTLRGQEYRRLALVAARQLSLLGVPAAAQMEMLRGVRLPSGAPGEYQDLQ